MSTPHYYSDADRVVRAQHCAFGDDDRGYCERPATVHLWTTPRAFGVPEGFTMSCDEHCSWFDTRRDLVLDHHPVTPVCGLPDTDWLFTHPAGGPGWCEMEGPDWLAAVEAADIPAELAGMAAA